VIESLGDSDHLYKTADFFFHCQLFSHPLMVCFCTFVISLHKLITEFEVLNLTIVCQSICTGRDQSDVQCDIILSLSG